MSKAVFQSEKAYLNVHHENLFHVGVVHTLYKPTDDGKGNLWIGSQEEWEYLQSLPAPNMVNRSYCFMEGDKHNQLTLTTDVEIEAMRVYAKTTDNAIVELDEDGNFPADPEGTPFISMEPHKVLYSGAFGGALNKTIRFNMGVERNKYITTDADEISAIRGYVRSHANCGISDPTYKDPFAEE